MASEISFLFKGDTGTITAFVRGQTHVVTKDHLRYHQIKEAIKKDDADELLKNIDEADAIRKYGGTGGSVEVRNGEIFYKGEVLHNVAAERVIQLMRADLPFEPMRLFLENLLQNPSSRARNELYRFLEHQDLPVTDDGHFLGYKRVRDNWRDFHSGKFDNSIGQVLEMDRGAVDDDFRHDCSRGFHVGALTYVNSFHGGTGHMLIVKVNPRDVVSVPEADAKKLRCCRYEVVSEFTGPLSASPLYSTTTGSPAPVGQFSKGEEPWEDDDDWDDDDDLCLDCGENIDECTC